MRDRCYKNYRYYIITLITLIAPIYNNKKASHPNWIACLSVYLKMAFNEGITRLAKPEKPQFTWVNEDFEGERNAVITR